MRLVFFLLVGDGLGGRLAGWLGAVMRVEEAEGACSLGDVLLGC